MRGKYGGGSIGCVITDGMGSQEFSFKAAGRTSVILKIPKFDFLHLKIR